jgi:hypothetical protein
MRVALIAAVRQDVRLLCADLLTHGLAHIVNQALQVKVLIDAEIRGDLLQMLLGADKRVPDLPGESSAFTA